MSIPPRLPSRGASDHGEPGKGVEGDNSKGVNRETSIKGGRQRRGKVTDTYLEEHLYEWLYSDRAIERA